MNKVIIIHGCPSDKEKSMDSKTRTYDKHWIPWMKKQLGSKEYVVEIPLMPEPWSPNYEKFKEEFEKQNIDEDSILIGHSCGCAFLVRWLGESNQKIKKLILVAPWKIPDADNKWRKEFYNYPINPEIKNNVGEVIIFTADDEEEDGKKSVKMFQEGIGGNIIELKNHGHYCLNDMGTEEFPELLEEVLK